MVKSYSIPDKDLEDIVVEQKFRRYCKVQGINASAIIVQLIKKYYTEEIINGKPDTDRR